jgi:hypothetical protein
MKRALLPSFCWLLLSCQPTPANPRGPVPNAVASASTSSSAAPPANEPRDFRFAIVSDRTGGHRGRVFESAIDKANLMRPEFVMSVGDLIEGYTNDPAVISAQWLEFRNIATEFEMPFYFVPGNHDISNPVMAAAWKEQFGRSYYHFVYGDVLFLCLNTEDGAPSHISEEQIEYAQRALSENRNVRWTLLFMHKPLWNANEEPAGRAGFERIEALLADRPYTVFAGHYHAYNKSVRNDRRYVVLATTGGVSQLRGPMLGEFDELAWVTMTNSGPRLANVLLDGILDEDVRTDASAARLDALSAAISVSVDNTYSKQIRFAGGSARLRIENRSDYDLQFAAQVGSSAPIQPVPHRFEPTLVKRQQSLVLPIKLKIEQPTPIALLRPIDISWNAKVLDSAQPLLLNDVLGLGISELRALRRVRKKPMLDGQLDDWGKLSFEVDGRYHRDSADYPRARPSSSDLSLTFDLTYDDENVYVAARVRDDVIVADKARHPWEQDGLELSIDVRDDPARGANRRVYSDAWRTYAYLAVSPPDANGQVSLFDSERIPKTVRVVCVRTADGYAAEFAFPHAALDATRPNGEWHSLRFNIGVNERDRPNGPKTVIWWQPDWHWQSNVPGAGTFDSTRKN